MKILIISHNPICNYNNMGKHLGSLFDSFKSEEICQIYVYPSIPDYKKCSSYYRITDIDVMKFFSRKKKGMIVEDKIILSNNGMFDNEKNKNIYRIGENKTPLKIIARDFMWKIFGWKSKKLFSWIEREEPTHIFVAPGRFKFIYDIAISIGKKYNLPIITNICDDFYFVSKPKSILGKVNLRLLQKKTGQLMGKTSLLVSISLMLSEHFGNKFNVNTLTLMTGTNYEIKKEPVMNNNVSCLRYFGNIGLGRFVSLVQVGKALDTINEKKGTNIKLEIYSGENFENALQAFSSTKCIEFKGLILGKQFEKIFFESPILIHTESFDERYIDIVKHSVSTKIADSLASGNCLIAYGPSSVSSIDHLKSNDYPAVIDDPKDLVDKLETYIFNEQQRYDAISVGLKIANKYHDPKKNSNELKKSIKVII